MICKLRTPLTGRGLRGQAFKEKATCRRFVPETLSMQVAARGEAHNVGPARVVDLLPIQGRLPLQHSIPKSDAVGPQQVIQRRHIGSACKDMQGAS